jgi:hypothetical protein
VGQRPLGIPSILLNGEVRYRARNDKISKLSSRFHTVASIMTSLSLRVSSTWLDKVMCDLWRRKWHRGGFSASSHSANCYSALRRCIVLTVTASLNNHTVSQLHATNLQELLPFA